MDDYNFKFRVVKNIGAGSKKTFGKVGTVIEVKDGKFTDNLGTEYGYLSKWDFESLKTYLEKVIFFERISTEIELVEESEDVLIEIACEKAGVIALPTASMKKIMACRTAHINAAKRIKNEVAIND